MLVKTYWAKGIFIRSGLKFGVVIIAESAYSIDDFNGNFQKYMCKYAALIANEIQSKLVACNRSVETA